METVIPPPSRLIPLPKADHTAPFHLAILLAETPPTLVNPPTAYKVLPMAAKPETFKKLVLLPMVPEPRADQLLPFHLARRLAEVPLAEVKRPATYTSVPI